MIVNSRHLYQEEDASDLFNKILQKLDSMKEGNMLNLGNEQMVIEWDEYKEDRFDVTIWQQRTIGHSFESYLEKDFFKFALYDTPLTPLRLEVCHDIIGYPLERFYFPLNNKYVKRDPIGFLTIWMKIAV